MEELRHTPLSEPKGVLFDMDGVLVDSMPVHAMTWKITADKYGLEADCRDFYLFEGMKGTSTVELLYRRTHDATPDPDFVNEVYEYKTSLFFSHKDEMPPIPGARELIQELKGRGIAMGVVTGSTLQNARPRIEKYYPEYFTVSHLVTADLVEHGKPAPDPYLRGIEVLGLDKEEILVIENAPLGVRSAHSAGLFTVAVTTGPVPEYDLRAEGANLVFANHRAVEMWWKATFPR